MNHSLPDDVDPLGSDIPGGHEKSFIGILNKRILKIISRSRNETLTREDRLALANNADHLYTEELLEYLCNPRLLVASRIFIERHVTACSYCLDRLTQLTKLEAARLEQEAQQRRRLHNDRLKAPYYWLALVATYSNPARDCLPAWNRARVQLPWQREGVESLTYASLLAPAARTELNSRVVYGCLRGRPSRDLKEQTLDDKKTRVIIDLSHSGECSLEIIRPDSQPELLLLGIQEVGTDIKVSEVAVNPLTLTMLPEEAAELLARSYKGADNNTRAAWRELAFQTLKSHRQDGEQGFHQEDEQRPQRELPADSPEAFAPPRQKGTCKTPCAPRPEILAALRGIVA